MPLLLCLFYEELYRAHRALGEFIDIKNAPLLKNPQKYAGSKIFVGTVTDGYNPFEAEYKRTRQFLEQFIGYTLK